MPDLASSSLAKQGNPAPHRHPGPRQEHVPGQAPDHQGTGKPSSARWWRTARVQIPSCLFLECHIYFKIPVSCDASRSGRDTKSTTSNK